jgi:hypothetical protein
VILLSLALVVASAAALGWGLATTSELLVWGSLFAGLAAVALVAGSVVRHRRRLASGAAGTATAPSGPVTPAVPPPAAWPWPADAAGSGTAGAAPSRSGWTGPVGPAPPAEGVSGLPAPAGTAEQPPADTVAASAPATDRPLGEPFPPPTADQPVPPPAEAPAEDGEPPVEDLPVRDALRVAQLDDGVQVVDGHPRYHLEECPTLAGAEPVPLPVSAARRAGFTPCAICAPDSTLLSRSRDRRSPPPAPADS